MSFHSSNGTRGARQPKSNVFMRLINDYTARRIRKGRKVMGMDALVLTTIGRKSGEPRSTPVSYFTDDEDGWLIAASAAGAAKNPAWYYNLAAHPDRVSIELGDRRFDVTATQLNGAERTRAWEKIKADVAQFATYEKTDREIPVVRLTPR